MAQKERVYVGCGWYGNYGSIIMKLKIEKLRSLQADKYGEISVIVAPRRKIDEKSKATHYVYENSFKRRVENDDVGF